MKINRKVLKVATGSALLLAVGSAYAFHDGGVAKCEGCHSMHATNGSNVALANAGKDQRLLKGSDESSTCLLCHNTTSDANPTRYYISSQNATALTAGGDFFWAKTSYTYFNGRSNVTSQAAQHGHNIVALDFPGFTADTINTSAPGGSYQAANLTCVSCHDPHGQQAGGTPAGQDAIQASGSYDDGVVAVAGAQLGNYRILGDAGYRAITAAAPVAVAHGTNKFGDTDAQHVAYGSGMSEWCLSCHAGFKADGAGGLGLDGKHRHPAGNNAAAALTAGITANYNAYVASGNFDGTQATAYSALVPFETGATDRLLLDAESTAGPGDGANVMCLSCHRAHASAWDNMMRWDAKATFLVEEFHPTDAELPAMKPGANIPYYGRNMATQFGEFQRSLCNKCHGKD